MKGYKATDKDMKCLGYQFELNVWHEHIGEIVLCNSGFHFCQYPSGPWCYYQNPTSRIFEVEAEEVLETPIEPGAGFKRVCRRIKLTKEITPVENNKNTGNKNTGYWNTGNWNTGNRNTGNSNTGNRNTGNRNTGDCNTGYWNTGYKNTGYCNTGYSNTGNRNTGDCNTGYWNTGNSNTGNWNATNYSSGFFCLKEPLVISFDMQTELTHAEFFKKYPESYRLGEDLSQDGKIDFELYRNIPGITSEKLRALHDAHKKGRK